jgi:hypothetical protein
MFHSQRVALLSLLASISAFAQNKSVYTDLRAEKCKTSEQSSIEDGYVGICGGVAGFALEISEGDLRQNIQVISPTKKKFDLGLWTLYSGFSSLGEKAEWRMQGALPTAVPVALIVRFKVADAEVADKITSYLIVTKISKASACVVDVVLPSKTQNADAQKVADKAATMACLEPN